jgi:hypothetical protein
MRTGFWTTVTAVLAVGMASAQTPESVPAPVGNTGGAGKGPVNNTAGAAASSSDAKAPNSANQHADANTQGLWDEPANGGACRSGTCTGRRGWGQNNGEANGTCWCERNNNFFVTAEYLLWRVNDSAPQEMIGLFVGSGISPNTGMDSGSARSGFRLSALGYLPDHCTGIEASGFFIDLKRSFGTGAAIDVGNAGLSSISPRVVKNLPVDLPGDLDPGDILTSLFTGTTYFRAWGAELNVHRITGDFGGFKTYILAGFRNFNLDETMTLSGDITFNEPNPDETTGPSVEDGRTVHMTTIDTIEAHNQYYGAQVGAGFDWHWYRVTVDALAKFGVGGTAEQVTAGGTTFLSPAFIEPTAGAPLVFRPAATLPGGLVSSTPQTRTDRVRLSVLPELRAHLGYQVTDNIRGFVGYNFIWVTNIATVGDQSSTTTTGTRDLWLQGLDFGVQVRW